MPLTTYKLLVAVALLAAFLGCRRGAEESTQPSEEGSGEASRLALEIPPPELLATMEEPEVVAASVVCAQDDDCRVYQPSDWRAEVECCYEYGCALDYVAINDDHWRLLRAWRAEHPFDCAAHLRVEGPCDNRPPRCGLDQTPPDVRCDGGRCTLDFPDPWPVIDPEAQVCETDGDCTSRPRNAESAAVRCCDWRCESRWVATNRETEAALRRWRTERAPPCAVLVEEGVCDDLPTCSGAAEPPNARCNDGLCTL